MDCGSGHALADQLAFERFRRQIPAMSHGQRGELLEQLAYSHFVSRPAAARLLIDMHAKAPTDWLQTAGAWTLEALGQAEACDYHW